MLIGADFREKSQRRILFAGILVKLHGSYIDAFV